MSNIPIISDTEYQTIIDENIHHLQALDNIIKNSTRRVAEGGIFYMHNSFDALPFLKVKQLNLFSLAREADNILEIGFNAGHSSLIMLLANKTSKITAVDLNEHPYVNECYQYLSTQFPGRINLYLGNSLTVLPKISGKFDLFHVDGCHESLEATIDVYNCYILSEKDKSVVILDDTNFPNVLKIWNDYVNRGYMKEFTLLETNLHKFGIFKK